MTPRCKTGVELWKKWRELVRVVDVMNIPGHWSQFEIRDACNTENANSPDYLDTFAAYRNHVQACEECGL